MSGGETDPDSPTQPGVPDPTTQGEGAAGDASGGSSATPKKKQEKKGWRRTLTRIGCAGGGIVGIIGLALVGTGGWLLTPGGQSFVVRQVEDLVTGSMAEGRLEIGDLRTDLFSELVVEDVRLLDGQDREVVRIGSARAGLDLASLVGLVVHLPTLDIDDVDADLQIDEDGNLDVVRMFATEPDPSAEPFEGLPVDLVFDAISLTNGHVTLSGPDLETVELDALTLKAAFEGRGLRYAVNDIDLDGTLVRPEEGPLTADGDFVWEGSGADVIDLALTLRDNAVSAKGFARDLGGSGEEVDLTLDVGRLDLDDINAFVDAGLSGQVGGTVTATGTLPALQVDGTLSGQGETRGEVVIDAKVDANQPAWDGTVDVRTVHVEDYIAAMEDPLPVTVKVRLKGSGATWPDGVETDAEILEADVSAFGVEIDRATGKARLEDGVVTVSELVAAGPVGEVTGSGTFDVQDGALRLDVHAEDADPDALRELGVPVELRGTRVTGDAVVTMNAYAEELDLTVTGSATASPLLWTRDIRARRVDADYEVRLAGTDVFVTADATGTDILAYGSELRRVVSSGISVDVTGTGIRCEGGLDASDIVYPLIPDSLVADLGRGVEADRGTGSWSVDLPFLQDAEEAFSPDLDALAVDVDVDVTSHRLLRYPGESGRIEMDLRGSQVDLITRLDASTTRRLADVDMDLDLDTLVFTFPTLQVAPLPSQTWTARSGATFRVEGTGVADLDLRLRSAKGELDLSGAVGLEGAQDLDVTVYDLDLAAIGDLLPMWVEGVEGYAGGVIALDGTAEAPELSGEIEVADVGYTAIVEEEDGEEAAQQLASGLGGRVTLDGQAERLKLDGRLNVDGAPLADLALQVPVILAFERAGFDPRGPVSADILLLQGGLGRVSDGFGLELPADAQVSGQLVLSGTPVAPTGRVVLKGSLPVDGLSEDVSAEIQLDKRKAGALTWRGTAREGSAERLRLTGSASTRVDAVAAYYLEGGDAPDWDDPTLFLDDLTSALELRDLPVRSISEASGLELDVDGTLAGDVQVSGSAMAPRVDGDIRLEDGRAGTVAVTNTELVVTSSDEGYELALSGDLEQDLGRTKKNQLGTLYLDGRVPLVVDFREDMEDWARGPLDLTLDVDVPVALASAYDRGVREATGYIELDGNIVGPIFDPAPSMSIATSRGVGLVYRPLGIRLREVEVDVDIDRHAIRVSRIAAETRPSRARLDTALSGALSGVGGAGEEAVSGLRRLFTRKKKQRRRVEDEEEGAEATERGTFAMKGKASLKEWVVEDIDVTLNLQQALLSATSEQLLRMTTPEPLTVKGDLAQPRVRGAVAVDESNVLLDMTTALGGSATNLDERIVIHRAGASISTAPAEESVFDDVDLELSLDLGRATRGRLIMPLEAVQWLGATADQLFKIDMRARLGGDLTVELDPCRVKQRDGTMKKLAEREGDCGLYHPHVTGNVDIFDGEARVLRADFTLSESQIRFVGNEVYNPNLDIHGTMDADDVEINMDITGTAYDPDINFSSPDSDQIFATLALGTSLDGLTAQQVGSQLALAVLSTALADVNLPSINIDPRGQVQIGLALGRAAFVEFTAGGTPRPDENVFEAELEYNLTRNLLLKAGFGAYAVPFWGDLLLERKFD